MIGDTQIYVSSYLVIREQFRFPTSKKRRIRKKWAKRNKNFRQFPDPKMYVLNMKDQRMGYIGHPATVQKLKEMI